MSETELDLDAMCGEIAADLEDISTVAEGGPRTYKRDGQAFARVSATTFEARLPGDIAEAARRTPDTVAGDDPGWIRFTPAGAEPHVTDRAEAWFRTAWRHAGND
jgi:hypothetical protein